MNTATQALVSGIWLTTFAFGWVITQFVF